MIGSTRQVVVYAYREPVDMRKAFNALTALVEQRLGRDVMSGEMFLFVNRTRKRAKVLFWDGTGLCLFAKRLAKGHFAAPWVRRLLDLQERIDQAAARTGASIVVLNASTVRRANTLDAHIAARAITIGRACGGRLGAGGFVCARTSEAQQSTARAALVVVCEDASRVKPRLHLA